MTMNNLLKSYQHGLYLELLSTIWIFVVTLAGGFILWKNPSGTEKYPKNRLVKTILVGSIATIIFLCLSVKSLILDGGVYILLAREYDAIYLEGVVQNVQSSDRFNFSGRGENVAVGDSEYYIWENGKLKPGDLIRFSYLPQNNMMLEYTLLLENCDYTKVESIQVESTNVNGLNQYNFPYDDYIGCVWSYGGVLLIAIFFPCTMFLGYYVYYKKRKKKGPPLDDGDKMVILFCIIYAMSLFFLLSLTPKFFYRLILLNLDKNEPSICVEGIIEEIAEQSKNFVPTNKAVVSDYYVDGVAYTSMEIPSAEVDTRVRMEYLPNSKIVLVAEILDE